MKLQTDYIRNLIFGTEDALVSTVGVLFGVASSGKYTPTQTILTGLIVIAVESISMGVGSFLTEESVHEIDKTTHKDNSLIGAGIMFLSYFLAGMATIAPYGLIQTGVAKYVSVGIALVLLFLLGLIPKRRAKDGARMVIIAGLAILVGFLIGRFDTFGILF